VRTPEHTRGHVLVVMLVYLIRRELSRARAPPCKKGCTSYRPSKKKTQERKTKSENDGEHREAHRWSSNC